MEVQKTKDKLPDLKRAIENLTKGAVLIGPIDAGDDLKEDIYLYEYGEPSLNIPANPFFLNSIDEANPKNIQIMKKGAQDILTHKTTLDDVLIKVGQNTVAEIKDNPIPVRIKNAMDFMVE